MEEDDQGTLVTSSEQQPRRSRPKPATAAPESTAPTSRATTHDVSAEPRYRPH